MSEHASWARYFVYLGAASLLLLPTGPLLTRVGAIPFTLGLLMVVLAALAAVLVALASMAIVNPHLSTGNRRALSLAGLLALPALACIVMVALRAGVPAIHNISTDLENPPEFVAAITARGPDSNPLDYSSEVAAEQRQAYPDLAPIETALPPEAAHRYATQIAEKLGWEIYASDTESGHIEAVDTTFWFGFKDDIVIRIRATSDGGSVVDLRSVSRVGRGDLGANAERIRTFRKLFETEA